MCWQGGRAGACPLPTAMGSMPDVLIHLLVVQACGTGSRSFLVLELAAAALPYLLLNEIQGFGSDACPSACVTWGACMRASDTAQRRD